MPHANRKDLIMWCRNPFGEIALDVNSISLSTARSPRSRRRSSGVDRSVIR
jgi:hypothetical protein